jgi:hypothetical protein
LTLLKVVIQIILLESLTESRYPSTFSYFNQEDPEIRLYHINGPSSPIQTEMGPYNIGIAIIDPGTFVQSWRLCDIIVLEDTENDNDSLLVKKLETVDKNMHWIGGSG